MQLLLICNHRNNVLIVGTRSNHWNIWHICLSSTNPQQSAVRCVIAVNIPGRNGMLERTRSGRTFEKLGKGSDEKARVRTYIYNLSIDCVSRIRLVHDRPASSSSSTQGKVESGWALERRSRETAGQTDGSGPNVPTKRALYVLCRRGFRRVLRELSDSQTNVGRGGSTKVKLATPGKPSISMGPGRDVVIIIENNRRIFQNENPPRQKVFLRVWPYSTIATSLPSFLAV